MECTLELGSSSSIQVSAWEYSGFSLGVRPVFRFQLGRSSSIQVSAWEFVKCSGFSLGVRQVFRFQLGSSSSIQVSAWEFVQYSGFSLGVRPVFRFQLENSSSIQVSAWEFVQYSKKLNVSHHPTGKNWIQREPRDRCRPRARPQIANTRISNLSRLSWPNYHIYEQTWSGSLRWELIRVFPFFWQLVAHWLFLDGSADMVLTITTWVCFVQSPTSPGERERHNKVETRTSVLSCVSPRATRSLMIKKSYNPLPKYDIVNDFLNDAFWASARWNTPSNLQIITYNDDSGAREPLVFHVICGSLADIIIILPEDAGRPGQRLASLLLRLAPLSWHFQGRILQIYEITNSCGANNSVQHQAIAWQESRSPQWG